MTDENWLTLNDSQKVEFVQQMYNQETGTGTGKNNFGGFFTKGSS